MRRDLQVLCIAVSLSCTKTLTHVRSRLMLACVTVGTANNYYNELGSENLD